MALKYLDLEGLKIFWQGTEETPGGVKKYIDDAAGLKVNISDIVNDLTTGGASKVLSAEQGKQLKTLIDNVTAGELTVPAATDAKIGGVKSGGDITVAGDGAVTVNQAAKLKTAQTISLTGGATGSTTFDGSGAASIAVTVDPAGHQHTIAQVTDLQTTLDAKAPLASPALTGTPTAPTAGSGTNTDQIATTAFVKAAIDSAVGDSDHIAIKGTVNTSTPLPTENYVVGDAYIVGEAGSYAGETCEAGDWIIAIKDYEADGAADSDWSKIQKNITSAVTFTGTPTAGQVVKFNAATGIVENAAFSETQVSGAITAAGTAVQTVTVAAPTGDANPTAQKSGTGVTINLPAYLLKSTYDTAIAGIDGTIKDYVDSAVADASISGSGTVDHTKGDAEAETVTIADNTITISLRAYALASAVTTLEAEVDANTAKLADVTTTVGAAIDAKITAGIAADGVIDNAIDAVITTGVTDGGVIDNRIDTVLDAAINKSTGTATAGSAAYIPTVAITSEEITALF